MAVHKTLKNIKLLYGKNPPREVFFAITNACNITCKTCTFGNASHKDWSYAGTDKLGTVLGYLKGNGVRMVSITGGEPMMHPNFLDICKEIDANGMMISYIATNGTLLDEHIASGLSRLNVNIVGLSIDQIDSSGKGITRSVNIEKTIPRAKRLLDKYGINSYAGIVLGTHTKNITHLMRLIRSWGFSKVVFSYPQVRMSSTYRAARDCEYMRISIEETVELVKAIEREKKINRSMSIFNTRVNLEEFLKAQAGTRTVFECPGGINQFYMDWNYDLFRCFNDGLYLGNAGKLAKAECPLQFHLSPCDGCTQQAFLDYGSFYHSFNVVRGVIDSLKRLDMPGAFDILADRKNRLALRSLIEACLEGFV
jgi:MoaA/NifB/PqqE/SkfB family radical SAM enzyme